MNADPATNAAANYRFGFVGAGRMAQALSNGIWRANRLHATGTSPAVCFVDPSDDAALSFQEACPDARRCANIDQLAQQSDLLLLAVKPQIMSGVLADLRPHVTTDHLIVSVAAGVPIQAIQYTLGTENVIRVMPNTPCLIGEGMSAMACPTSVSARDREQVKQGLLEHVGKVVEVDEARMDAVTGLSGSGPAYVFTFIESLIEAGVDQGLEKDVARQLALQTVLGAARLVEQTGRSPEDLRNQVTSPGGTTLAGLQVLADEGFQAITRQAVAAATRRSMELAKPQ